MVRCTSTASHREEKDSGREVTQSQKILQIIQTRGNMSLTEIQNAFELRYNIRIDKGTVSARVNKLKKDCLVGEDLPRQCFITGKVINPVYAIDPGE